MSDVTGNLGGESIRLRGMALEDTQQKVLEEIEDLVKVTEAMAKKQGLDKKEIKEAKQKNLKQFGKQVDDAGDSAKKTGTALEKLSNLILKGAGTAFQVLNQTVGANLRVIRNFDSNIDDASYSMRALTQNFRGGAASVAKFAVESLNQLQDQYQAFKKMSDISGVVSSDFENLRVMANSMNMTLDQYAGLMQENFLNLRTGGNTVRKSMIGLTAAVNDLNNDDELGYLFQRLGIDANQYGRVILQQTALNRGLNRDMSTYSEGFAKAMQKSVISSLQLADAFGVQRSDMLEARKKAQEDVFFSKMYDNLSDVAPEVKDTLLDMFKGMTGGDIEKAKQLAISSLTGIPTQAYRDVMAAGGGELLEAITTGAKRIAKDADAMPSVMDDIAKKFEKHSQQYGGTVGDLARFLTGMDAPLKDTFMMLFNGARMFAGKKGLEGVNDALAEAEKARKDPNQRQQIDILRDLQKENIKMARAAAKANISINSFGLTLAHTTQLLTKIMNAVTTETVDAFGKNPDIQGFIGAYRAETEKYANIAESYAREVSKEIMEDIVGGAVQGVKDAAGGSQQSRPTAVSAAGTPLSNMVNVKTTTAGKIERMKAGEIDDVVGQHNRGGKSNLAIRQLIGVLAGSNNLTVAGMMDQYNRGGNSAHDQGLAVDFTLPGGKLDYEKKHREIYNLLVGTYGLVPKKDFDLVDELNFPSRHATGPHMHLEFTKEGAAKFQNKFKGFFENSPVSAAPGSGGSSQTAGGGGGGGGGTSSSAIAIDQTLAGGSNTGAVSMSNSLNNTTTMVAIADDALLGKFDMLSQDLGRVKNSVDGLKGLLEGATYG